VNPIQRIESSSVARRLKEASKKRGARIQYKELKEWVARSLVPGK